MDLLLRQNIESLGRVGDVVKVKVWRDGKDVELDVTLRAAKPKE